jgi:hypothetical protein
VCYRDRSRVPVPSGEEDDQRGATGRNHFLSTFGMIGCSYFAIVILAQGLASFFINPCWD